MNRAPALLEPLPEPSASPWRAPGLGRGLLLVALLFVATRAVVWTAAYTGAIYHVRLLNDLGPPFNECEPRVKVELAQPESKLAREVREHLFAFAPLLKWDAPHYRSIVQDGYSYRAVPPGTPFDEAQFNIAFFPLYPVVCAAFRPLLGVPGAMVAVAHLALLAGVCVLYAWVRWRADERTALWSVALTLTWPTACFYSFGYSESLNLLLAALCFLLLERRQFWLAALCCGLATATRPTAITLVPVFLLAYWWIAAGSRGRRLALLPALGLLACGGAALYAGYLTWRFGSPAVYYENLRAGWIPAMPERDREAFYLLARVFDQFKFFGRSVRDFPIGLWNLANPVSWNMALSLALVLASLLALPRVPAGFRALLLVGPLIFIQRYLVSGWNTFGLESMSRYMMLATPTFVALAAWCAREWHPAARTTLVVLLMLLQTSWAFHFGMGDWTG